MNSITVFCGSSSGSEKEFGQQAFLLGKKLAEENIKLIYGGAKIGLMGSVAKGSLDYGGYVVGVIPTFLKKKEIVHDRLTELIVVKSMHERKSIMHDLCDGFIVLPGGIGTLEEFFEMLTWAQLGRHSKPIGILNTNGYYNELLSFMQSMLYKRFITTATRKLFVMSDDIDELIEKMKIH